MARDQQILFETPLNFCTIKAQPLLTMIHSLQVTKVAKVIAPLLKTLYIP
jgi:hypothetical protein